MGARRHALRIRRLCPAWLAAAALGAALAAADDAPSLRFTSVPARGSTDDLRGRASGVVVSNAAVAVYVYVNGWWTKPTFLDPLTPLDSNGDWVCDVTTGGRDAEATTLAAFLVPRGYTPPQASGQFYLPSELYENALARQEAYRPAALFSTYQWAVKDSLDNLVGPGPNYFSSSADNVFVDKQGRLHLRITRRDGRWYCAEVISARTFGYGTYRVFLDSRVDNLDPNVVLGLFTWDDEPVDAHRELDVELTRWGDPEDPNQAQFVVQPFGDPGHRVRYSLPQPTTNSTHGFLWRSNRVDFASFAGPYVLAPATNTTVFAWTFAQPDVPRTGHERFRMNLWLCAPEPAGGTNVEVVVSGFVFVPDPPPAPVLTGSDADADGTVSLNFTTEAPLRYHVQAAAHAETAGWKTLTTVTATGAVYRYTDRGSGAAVRGSYRVVVPEQ